MTREQAIGKVFDMIHHSRHTIDSSNVEKLVNDIYDEFEHILAFNMKAYQQGYEDCKDEFESKDKKLRDEINKYENMVEWMEANSNTSLCDYYNREIEL